MPGAWRADGARGMTDTLVVIVALPLAPDEDAEEMASRITDRLTGLPAEWRSDGLTSYETTSLRPKAAMVSASRGVRSSDPGSRQ